ncbi:MAG TPA: cytochrome c biogenesis protein CcsA [Bacteroidota bacterium]|nr:cytochrome c biogenesis protein CcsA [Bacteroidota bacterium]
MTVLGDLVVLAALLTAFASAFFYAVSNSRSLLSWPRRFLRAHLLFVCLASALLLYLLLTHDYSIGYVYSYSDNALPLQYLISSFYAGQEGSFLFWALCSAIIAGVLARTARKTGTEGRLMAVFMSVQSFLLLLVVARSPFRSLWETFPGAPAAAPGDGHGLNPLLQNFWMVIHPPVLFIGFAAMAVPFSFAVAGLWKKEYGMLTSHGLPWLLFAVGILGLGIMLGAYWAYGVLGWGGYWGWDPVENSSLIPWLTGVALLHTLLAERRTGRYAKTNFALAMASYLLVIFSTFLTRSGILGDASVHAFTDPGAVVYWLLLGGLAVLALASIALLLWRFGELRGEAAQGGLLTRETALYVGAIALCLSACVVLFGTSLPIFSRARVETGFYDSTNLPIAIVLLFLIAYSLYMPWEIAEGSQTLKRSLRALGGAAGASLALALLGVSEPTALLLIFAAVFALIVNTEFGVRLLRSDPWVLGGKIAHIGLALFLIGVIATGKFSVKQQASLPLYVPQPVLGRTLTYAGYKEQPDGKVAFNVKVEGKGETFQLSPVMFANGDQGLMRNPDIASFLTRDFYVSPLSLEESHPAERMETYTIERGQTISIGGVRATFVSFDPRKVGAGSDSRVGSVLDLTDGKAHETVVPVLDRSSGSPVSPPCASHLMNADISLLNTRMSTGNSPSSVTVKVVRPDALSARPEALLVEASVKPWIILIWGGTVILLGGFCLAIIKRSKEA